MIPVAEQYISESQENLKGYYDELARKYHAKLSELHELKVNEKPELHRNCQRMKDCCKQIMIG